MLTRILPEVGHDQGRHKKLLGLTSAIIMLSMLFAACGNSPDSPTLTPASKEPTATDISTNIPVVNLTKTVPVVDLTETSTEPPQTGESYYKEHPNELPDCTLEFKQMKTIYGQFYYGSIFRSTIVDKSYENGQAHIDFMCKYKGQVRTIRADVRGLLSLGGPAFPLADAYNSDSTAVGKQVNLLTFAFVPKGSTFTGESWVKAIKATGEDKDLWDDYEVAFSGWGGQQINQADVQKMFDTQDEFVLDGTTMMLSSLSK